MKRRIILFVCFLVYVLSIHAYKKQIFTIMVNGENRTMIVYTPSTVSNNMPLMIVTHDMNQDAEHQASCDHMYELIDLEKFVIAYLNGINKTWDTGGTKDRDFVSQTIDEMYTRYKINKNRVYWSGFSMGSALIYSSMADMQDKIAAFAPTSGIAFGGKEFMKCKKPVNVIHCHAYGDDVFKYNDWDIRGYVTSLAKDLDQCKDYKKTTNYRTPGGNTGDKEVWTNGKDGSMVELFSYNANWHSPSLGNSQEIWNFCKQFSIQTLEEKYQAVYQKAKSLIIEWQYTPDMTSTTVYASLEKALEAYAPEKMTTDDDMTKAIEKLTPRIELFESTSAGKTKVVNGDDDVPPIVLTAKSYARQYGEANPAFEFTSIGAALEGEPDISCEATIDTPVGIYPIVISKGSVANMKDSYVNGTLTITKAPLTISVGDYTKEIGEENPSFILTYTGFKNGETESVLTRQPTINCAATEKSPVGIYSVNVSYAEAINYDINYINGTLIIKEKLDNVIPFSDATVKNICISNWDHDGDGELSKKEAAAVSDIGNVFRNKTIKSFNELLYFTSLTSIRESAFDGCNLLTSISIPQSVTSIGHNAFYGCGSLTSITIPDNIVSIGTYSFPSNTKVYTNKGSKTLLTLWKYNRKPYDKSTEQEILPPTLSIVSTTQTTASIKIENWCDGYAYKCNGEVVEMAELDYIQLRPSTTQNLNLVISSGDVHYDINRSFTTQGLLPRIEEWTSTASSISATGTYTEDDAKVVASNIQIANNEVVEGNQCYMSGLNPGRSYTVTYNIEVDYGGTETATYTCTKEISTDGLQFNMAQPKVVSEGNVIVSASANLDEDEENVGFEWRSTDWTNEFPSNTGTAYLYDGTIEGYIKNLNTSKLWKCRPYYLSNSGIYHYGDWMGIDPTNTSYFEPTVRTYSKITINGNTALVRGYALSGTDEVKVQGFKYWRTRKGGGIHHKVIAVPTDAITVELNNKQQTLTTILSDLEYDSEYCCVAFVTTTDGSTFYGEEQTFITEAPSAIESVETGRAFDESVIEVARYNMNGQQISAPQKGVNIIKYKDGKVKKVYVK